MKIDGDLGWHVPSAAARRRAEAAGLDLDRLKQEDPVTYRMLCAVPILTAFRELLALAQAPLAAALGDQQLFDAPLDDRRLAVLAFPGPSAAQLRRLDELMGPAIEPHTGRYAFYRVVQERSGTRRELGLPANPANWQGAATMVGPFASEQEADEWGSREVTPRTGMTYDVIEYAGGLFCDVFSAGDA